MHKLLLIEADAKPDQSLLAVLETASFVTERIRHPKLGLTKAACGEADGILFKSAEPGSTVDFVRTLREHCQTPLVVLCVDSNDTDRILCLESGADDYLACPFHPRELVARLRSVLRRASGALAFSPKRLALGALQLDSNSRTAWLAGSQIEFTTVEFNVLELLMRQCGRVVSREQLAQSVLGRTFRHYDRSIDMHVSRVRKKLGDSGNGKGTIRTIRNVGYMLTPTSLEEPARTERIGENICV